MIKLTRQALHRTWNQFEAFAAAFASLYFVGGVRILFSFGIEAGGPVALISSFIVTVVLMTVTAASLAEICSAVPLSGSIYSWAAESGGRRFGRLAGFVVAFWTTTAWTSFVASNTQATANFLLSELVVFDVDFPGGITTDNVKFRAVQWAVSIAFLALALLVNYMPPRAFALAFRVAVFVILVDALLTFIWLPIAVSRTYGFQPASFVFTQYENGTGAPDVWNFMLSFLFSSGVLTGFDAAGHVAEEVQGASLKAARGVFWSCLVTGVLALPTLILFLFCSPDLDTLFALDAPQPFVLIYQLSLGTGGQVFMTIVCIAGLFMNTVVAIVAASRLVFAIARDGVLPGSRWIGKVDADGIPRHATLFICGVAAFLVCTILPSPVAFTSLVSAGAVPTIAAYGLIALLRLINKTDVSRAQWSLGRFSTIALLIAVPWCAFIVAVDLSPVVFPVDSESFNYAVVIFGGVTILALISYFLTPESVWLPNQEIKQLAEGAAQQVEVNKSK